MSILWFFLYWISHHVSILVHNIFRLSLDYVDDSLLIFYTYKFRDAFCPPQSYSHMACELCHKIGQPFLLIEAMGNTEYWLNSFNLIDHYLRWKTTFGLYWEFLIGWSINGLKVFLYLSLCFHERKGEILNPTISFLYSP